MWYEAGMRKIEPPNDAERKWIAENVERAAAMAAKYGGEAELSAAGLDRVWVLFTKAIREQSGDPNGVINMIGLGFGHLLANATGLAWAVVTDENGTEIALHRVRGDVLVFPTNLVAKRWQSGEGEFLAKLFDAMTRDIGAL